MFGLMKRRAIQKAEPRVNTDLLIQKERRRLEKEIGKLEKQHKKATKAYAQTGNHAAAGEFRAASFVASSAGFFGAASDLKHCTTLYSVEVKKIADYVALAGAHMRQEIENMEDRIQELKTQLERLR